MKRRLARILIFAYWCWLALLALDALAAVLVWFSATTDSSTTLAIVLAFYFMIGVVIAFPLWQGALWAHGYLERHQ